MLIKPQQNRLKEKKETIDTVESRIERFHHLFKLDPLNAFKQVGKRWVHYPYDLSDIDAVYARSLHISIACCYQGVRRVVPTPVKLLFR